jgi:hypothetical protein
MPLFPSVEWFRMLAERMTAQPEKYRKLGAVDLLLFPRVVFPDGGVETFRLAFRGHGCTVDAVPGAPAGAHALVLEGAHEHWREMIDNIRTHGRADLRHTLNYLTLPDWPLRLVPVDEAEGQLATDRFYRYAETLQEFFDEAAGVDTRYAA